MIDIRPIPSCPRYGASADGAIWSLRRGQWKKKAALIGKTHGYPVVGIYDGHCGRKTRCVHQLVLEAFVGPRPAGYQAAHDNGIRQDCRLGNLRWATRSENEADKKRHNTSAAGERHGQSKLTSEAVIEIRKRHQSGELQQSIAASFEVCESAISLIASRKRWKHIGEHL